MNELKMTEILQEKNSLENMNNALMKENAELKLREEQYMNTIKQQSMELEKLRIVAQALEKHFRENGSGWQVERCVGCGKCDYILLEESLSKALAANK